MNDLKLNPDRLALTYIEAAEVLGVSPRTIWTLVNSGQLPAARIGRCVRVERAELEKFLAARTEDSRQAGRH